MRLYHLPRWLRASALALGFLWAALAPAPARAQAPEGHCLLLPLALAVPGRWRPLVLLVPVLMALGRLVLGAHYLSDVLFSIWLVLGYTVLFGQLRRVA